MSRILLVHQPVDGGVGRHVGDLARGMAQAGHEIVVCGPQPPAGTDGVRHIPLDLRRAVSAREDLAAARRFARIVASEQPELVHAHSSKAGAVARVARVAHPRVPVVYSPHGYAFAGHFESERERSAYRLAERALAPAASRVVCVCEAEARLARSIGSSARVRVVHNGIAPPAEGPVDARIEALAARGPVIGALTLLRPGKGVETLIDAMPAVRARRPDAQLAIVGDGPGLQDLRARAQRLGVAESVSFVGPTEEPLSALRGMTVFAHPSWAEAFPYVILEAMALGLPIVATAVGGVGEALVDADSGVLVAPRDAGALAGALVDVLDDPRRMSTLGARALRRASKSFTLASMVSGIERVYAELTAGGRLARDSVSAARDRRPELPTASVRTNRSAGA